MKFHDYTDAVYFREYCVPDLLQDIARAVMKRFTVYEHDDVMFVCRVVGSISGMSNGGNLFYEPAAPINHKTAQKAAEILQKDMWSRIREEDIPELTLIIESGGEVNPALAREGIKRFIKENEDMLSHSDIPMKTYYNKLIEKAENNLSYFPDLTTQKDHIRLDDEPFSWHIIDELPYQNGHTYYLLEPESYEKNYHPIIDEDYNIILDHAFFGFQDLYDYLENHAEESNETEEYEEEK